MILATVQSAYKTTKALIVALTAALTLAVLMSAPSHAVKPIEVSPDQDRIEVTTLGQMYEGRGDSLQVDTAPGADGAVSRMAVPAAQRGTNPNWIVFALTNPTDKPMERWLSADRYTAAGSGIVKPDLDARRIKAITPSLGFVPEPVKSDRADVFRITLEPGQTITYVAELTSGHFARVFLWKPLEYELKVRDKLLFNGVLLGLTGLLGIFLTAIFAANHKPVFPAAALVCWSALAYLCVDFGFFHKLFQLKAEDYAVYRAASEAALAFSLVVFLHVFLRLALWGGMARMLISVWMLAQISLVGIAIIDPVLASTFARVSFGFIGLVGSGLVLYLALRGQDRALSLVPPWMLFVVWIFAAGMVLSGRLTNEMAVSGLVSGLVLILVLIGFTVTQFAFRSSDPVFAGQSSDLQMRSLAVDAAGAAVWEWNTRRDEIKTDASIEDALGLAPGELNSKTEDFLRHVKDTDRERLRSALRGMRERGSGEISVAFQLRHTDNSHRWFEIEAASVPTDDPKNLRCVGLIRDVTDTRRAHERLVQNAVKCPITGLPHRELLLDRMSSAMLRARTEPNIRPTLITVGVDKFKSVNTSFGLVVGDSLLLAVARRLQRHIGEHDSLARLSGDQFGILLVAQQSAADIAALAERIRRSMRSPIKLAGQEIVLTGSLGIAIYDGEQVSAHDLLKESESALYLAKRSGTDRIEVFKPEMRGQRDDRITIESDLRKAIDKSQIRVFYQPIVALGTEELAGFEALVRWEHPVHGLINPGQFVPVAEDSDLILKLGSYVLNRAVKDAVQWQQELPRTERPVFVSINISRRQLMREDLVQEVRSLLGRSILPSGTLKLEITETLVMENPEQAAGMLEQLRGSGAGLALDDFGAGYSSLAYLHQFPFDIIKIDRTLIHSGGGLQSANATIVRSMVALCHELGKQVVAEGVETAEDASFLRGIECEFAQGYHYGDAMPDRDVIQMLREIRKTESKMQPRTLFRAKAKAKPVNPEAPPLAGQSQDGGSATSAALGAAAMSAAAAAQSKPRAPKSKTSGKPARPGASVPAPPGLVPMPMTAAMGAPIQIAPLGPNPLLDANASYRSAPPPLPNEQTIAEANDLATVFARPAGAFDQVPDINVLLANTLPPSMPPPSHVDMTPNNLNGAFMGTSQAPAPSNGQNLVDALSSLDTAQQRQVPISNMDELAAALQSKSNGADRADTGSNPTIEFPIAEAAVPDFVYPSAPVTAPPGPENGYSAEAPRPPDPYSTQGPSRFPQAPFLPKPSQNPIGTAAKPMPIDLSKLPPSVAASLARLAGGPPDQGGPKPVMPSFIKPAIRQP